MKLSVEFRSALSNADTPLYVLAVRAGLHPSRISFMKGGGDFKRAHDVRIRILADLIRYEGELFEDENAGVRGPGATEST